MEKKLWSADSDTWLGLTLLYSVVGFGLSVWASDRPSWILTLPILLLFVITVYSFNQFIQARSLEKLVNFELKEFGYTHVLQGVVPEVVDKQFLGFAVDGLNYPKLTVEGGYYVEETKHPKTPVTMYEYQFIDPKNNILVVFNETEPPTKGGVQVFVK